MLIETGAVITFGKSLWDKCPEEFRDWLKNKGIEYAKDWWEKAQFGQAEMEYKKKLFDDYGSIKLLGSSKPIPLEGIFTDVYILEELSAHQYFDIENLEKSDRGLHINSRVKRLAGMDAVKQNSRLYILGKPGAGKTTFLRYVAMQAIKGELNKTPIFVSLHQWANTENIEYGHKVPLTLMEFIIKQFDIYNFPDAGKFVEFLLEKGDAIVLLDGLDEVSSIHDTYIKSEIDGFCKGYKKTQFLITCRIAAKKYKFERFTDMEVADFDGNQIQTFVKKRLANPSLSDSFLAEFEKDEYQGLRDLASNPLLLGMLCLSFEKSKKFSTKRFDIYRRAFTVLLKTWDEDRFTIARDTVYKELDEDCKIQLFEFVGYETFNKKEYKYIIPQTNIERHITDFFRKTDEFKDKKIKGDIVLKSIEANHGIFVERAQELYSFAHLTFQEYFTACAISKNEKYQQELMQNIADPRYREVFLLTASSLDNADNFFQLFKQAIDNLIIKDEKILALLAWAKNKADTIESSYPKQDVYLFYVFLEITSTLDRDPALAAALDRAVNRDNPALAINLRRGLARTLDFAYALYLERDDLAVALSIAHNYDRDSDFDFDDLKGAFDRAFDSEKMKFDYSLYIMRIIYKSKEGIIEYENIPRIVNFMKEADLPELAEIFENKKWNDFELKLEILTQKQNIVLDWYLSSEQVGLFINYLKANVFCRDCLKLATVSNRQALEDNLFFTAKPEN